MFFLFENTADNIYCKFKFMCNRLSWFWRWKRNCPIDFLLLLGAHFYTFRLQYLNIASFMSFSRTKSHTEKNRILKEHTHNIILWRKEGRQTAEQEWISWLKFNAWRKTWIKMYLHNIELVECHVSALNERHTHVFFSIYARFFCSASAKIIQKWEEKRASTQPIMRNVSIFSLYHILYGYWMVGCRNYYLSSMRSFQNVSHFLCYIYNAHTTNKIKHLCVSGCHCAFQYLFFFLCYVFFLVLICNANVFPWIAGGACMESGNFLHIRIRPFCKGCVKTQHTYIF